MGPKPPTHRASDRTAPEHPTTVPGDCMGPERPGLPERPGTPGEAVPAIQEGVPTGIASVKNSPVHWCGAIPDSYADT
jgi:hypothetical protein